MATQTLATVAAALSQLLEPEITAQYNRSAATASQLSVKPGRGKNVAWDVTFGARTAAAYADGGAYATPTADTKVAAVLPWAYYAAPFSLSTQAVDAAMSSAGTPADLMDIFHDSVIDAARNLASLVNIDVLTGTGTDGTNPNIVGLTGGALAASGTYAGLSRTTYPTWAGGLLANGGTPRAISMALMDAMDAALFSAVGQSADLIVMNPTQHTNYKALFNTFGQYLQGGSGQVTSVGAGTNNVTYNGVPVIRDKDATSGKILFLNRSAFDLVYLPFAVPGLDGSKQFGAAALEGSAGFGQSQTTGVPFLIEALPRQGSAYQFVLRAQLQLKMKRPNACGILADIT